MMGRFVTFVILTAAAAAILTAVVWAALGPVLDKLAEVANSL